MLVIIVYVCPQKCMINHVCFSLPLRVYAWQSKTTRDLNVLFICKMYILHYFFVIIKYCVDRN